MDSIALFTSCAVVGNSTGCANGHNTSRFRPNMSQFNSSLLLIGTSFNWLEPCHSWLIVPQSVGRRTKTPTTNVIIVPQKQGISYRFLYFVVDFRPSVWRKTWLVSFASLGGRKKNVKCRKSAEKFSLMSSRGGALKSMNHELYCLRATAEPGSLRANVKCLSASSA